MVGSDKGSTAGLGGAFETDGSNNTGDTDNLDTNNTDTGATDVDDMDNGDNSSNNPDQPEDPEDGGSGSVVDLCSLDTTSLCGEELIENGDFEVVDSRKGLTNGLRLKDLSANKLWDVYATLPGGRCGVSWYAEDHTSGIEVQAGTEVKPASGKHYVELDSHANSQRGSKTNSGMYQFVEIEQASTYCLSYRYRGRVQSADDNRIDVIVDGDKVASMAEPAGQVWHKVKLSLSLKKGQRQILFRAAGAQNTKGGFLDLVSLKKICSK